MLNNTEQLIKAWKSGRYNERTARDLNPPASLHLLHKKVHDALDDADDGNGTVRVHRKFVDIPKALADLEAFTESLQEDREGAEDRVKKLPKSAGSEFAEAVNRLREKNPHLTTEQAHRELRKMNPGLAGRYDGEHGFVFRSTFSE